MMLPSPYAFVIVEMAASRSRWRVGERRGASAALLSALLSLTSPALSVFSVAFGAITDFGLSNLFSKYRGACGCRQVVLLTRSTGRSYSFFVYPGPGGRTNTVLPAIFLDFLLVPPGLVGPFAYGPNQAVCLRARPSWELNLKVHGFGKETR